MSLEDELLTILSCLGAINPEKAVPINLLRERFSQKKGSLEDRLRSLVEAGYIAREDERLYLTASGLIRAFSRFS